ncbi:MAG: glycosyltransferase family 4 protein [Candidatus Taylorbacteria bacterium]|nr:glycosyltransferase family 4 protein [Candidatus Taylorbacteria bacterium]
MKEKTSKNKVLYVITKSNFGGAQRYVYELAKRSHEEGIETAVALGGNGILVDKLKEIGITIFPLESAVRDIHLTKEFKLLLRLYSVVKSFQPTVLHLNSPKIGGIGAVVGRILRIPKIIYTNHGWPFKEERPEWQLMLIRFFSWLTIFFNKKIIVLSETEKDFVKRWPTASKKIEVIPNGLSPFDAYPKEVAQKKLGIETSPNTLVIGTIAELHKNKGLTYAIEGIRMYLDHNPAQKTLFAIIGEGERRHELESQIKASNMGKNVILCGHIDNARLYLNAFDIFLLSSIKEGLPYAILEAGYTGVPVISTSVGGIPEVIKNFETGLLIPPRRPQEIKNALIYIEEHPEIIQKISTGLSKKVKDVYDFDIVYKKTHELYN